MILINRNTFAGLVGKEEGREGGEKESEACPPDPGLEPGTCRVLGEGPHLHTRGAV